jgi:penicillin-binding protein 2
MAGHGAVAAEHHDRPQGHVRRGQRAGRHRLQGGTAYNARIKDEALAMAGKSGSAQVRRITLREREAGMKKQDQIPWKDRDHALFVAYAPESAPRWAICVTVEHGIGGSSTAAPICRDILLELQKRDPQKSTSQTGCNHETGHGSCGHDHGNLG